jgi:hypothetical protein
VEVLEETTRTVSTNTDLDMREFLGIDKALTRIKRELENNASKLSKIDKHLKKNEVNSWKLKATSQYLTKYANASKIASRV